MTNKNGRRVLALAEAVGALICLAIGTYGLAALLGIGAVLSAVGSRSGSERRSSLWLQSLLMMIALFGAFVVALTLAAVGVLYLNTVQVIAASAGVVASLLGVRRVIVSRPTPS